MFFHSQEKKVIYLLRKIKKKRFVFLKIITKLPDPIGTTTPNSFQMSWAISKLVQINSSSTIAHAFLSLLCSGYKHVTLELLLNFPNIWRCLYHIHKFYLFFLLRTSLERWRPIRWFATSPLQSANQTTPLESREGPQFFPSLLLKKQSTDITNPDTRPGCFEEVHAGAGDQSWRKLICAIDTCMNLIERNKQPSFHGKKDVKKVEKGKNRHGCLISTPIIDSLRML